LAQYLGTLAFGQHASFKYNIHVIPFQLGKFLVILGVLLVAVGLLLMTGAKFLFFGLGKLPGDIAYKGKNVQFYFPIVTCLVLSLVLTLVSWVISLFTKR
jgi:uncharacterized membrane protein YidH (DUF202 family)